MAQRLTDKGAKPEIGNFLGFDHCKFWVSNALQAASFYVTRFGFKRIAYRGLSSVPRDSEVTSHVVAQNNCIFVFQSPMGDHKPEDMAVHIAKHGDGVKDIAFTVDDCRGIFAEAVKRGAKVVSEPRELTDEHGSCWVASVATYGDTVHTFVERSNYKGAFLPGYAAVTEVDPLADVTPTPALQFIDHIVGNQPDKEMEPVAKWYEDILQFHRFWSVDDSVMHTEFSALRSIVMADYSERVKMPINEPADGKKKSQIQEYVEWYNGAGAQHIALNTPDIITAVTHLRARGVQFLAIPDSYYDDLRVRLSKSPVTVKEEIDTLQKLQVLVDFDDNGYLLQLFTKPLEDRPTLFIEIIQRANHDGFGAGNFKALFESIEREQALRGNL